MNKFTPFWEELAEAIREFAEGYQLVYVPNFGNMGDAYIRYATQKFLVDHGISHTEIGTRARDPLHFQQVYSSLELPEGNVRFLFGGGGAWNRRWNVSFWIRDHLEPLGEVMVLPSTYEEPYYDLNRTTFWARDHGNSKFQRFAPDLAFYVAPMDKQDLYMLRQTALYFRRDIEGKGRLPLESVDPSAIGDHLSRLNSWLTMVLSPDRVHTDRLHIAIARSHYPSLTTFLYPGVCEKNRLVYEASMKEMENVVFVNAQRGKAL